MRRLATAQSTCRLSLLYAPDGIDGDDTVTEFSKERDLTPPTVTQVGESMDEDDGILVRVSLLAEKVV